MPLSDIAARQAKAREKPYKLFDGHGLYLEVTPQGSKLWRLKYRFDGEEKRISFGPYPEVKLADARDRRTEARRMLRDRIDPAQQRKDERNVSITLETVVRDWHEARRAGWTDRHADDVLQSFEKDIFPSLDSRPIGKITWPEMYEALRKIWRRGALEIASRVQQRCHAACEHAITRGIIDKNPVPPPIALTRRKKANPSELIAIQRRQSPSRAAPPRFSPTADARRLTHTAKQRSTKSACPTRLHMARDVASILIPSRGPAQPSAV